MTRDGYAWLLAVWLVAALPTHAQEVAAAPAIDPSAPVLILYGSEADPVLDEVLVRARAELMASGLSVQIQPSTGASGRNPLKENAAYQGALAFQRQDDVVITFAWAPGISMSLAQPSDAEDDPPDAEVIAIRAVEALRAVMLQYASQAEADGVELSPSLRRFTRLAEARAPDRKPDATALDPPAPAGPVEPAMRAWLGPLVSAALAGPTSWGLRGAVTVGRGPLAAGLGIEHTWAASRLANASGQAEVRRTALFALAELQHPVSGVAYASLRLGAGMGHYGFDGTAAAGYLARPAVHWTPLFIAEALGRYQPTSLLGLYVGLGAATAIDAPAVRLAGREVGRVDRPSLTASAGIVLGAW
jgi:hypothetical protein